MKLLRTFRHDDFLDDSRSICWLESVFASVIVPLELGPLSMVSSSLDLVGRSFQI